MATLKWCFALVAFLGLLWGINADPKKCVNTPFDLVFASEDSSRVAPATVVEVNRVLKAMAAQLDIGGQHRIAYLTMTTTTVNTNFDLADHNTLTAINDAVDMVMDQDGNNAAAQIPQGIDAIRTEFTNNPKPGVSKIGLVIDATQANPAALETAADAAFGDDIIMYAIGVGAPFSPVTQAVSTIIRHPNPIMERHRRALSVRDYNFFRENVLENPILRLLCPGDIGGRCGRDTPCDKAANTVCVHGNCKCNEGLQNMNGVCVTGPVLLEMCNMGECSVANSECLAGMCVCREGFTRKQTTVCDDDEDGEITQIRSLAAVVAGALPFLLTSINLQNPSTLAAVTRR